MATEIIVISVGPQKAQETLRTALVTTNLRLNEPH
jgi:electron transfer flavoprotein alpha/beta subunit